MGEVLVLNKEQCTWQELEGAALVDRTTVYGNPFVVGVNAIDRNEAVLFYKYWILSNNPVAKKLRRRMRNELRGKNLICHCAPELCHAETIRDIANG